MIVLYPTRLNETIFSWNCIDFYVKSKLTYGELETHARQALRNDTRSLILLIDLLLGCSLAKKNLFFEVSAHGVYNVSNLLIGYFEGKFEYFSWREFSLNSIIFVFEIYSLFAILFFAFLHRALNVIQLILCPCAYTIFRLLSLY